MNHDASEPRDKLTIHVNGEPIDVSDLAPGESRQFGCHTITRPATHLEQFVAMLQSERPDMTCRQVTIRRSDGIRECPAAATAVTIGKGGGQSDIRTTFFFDADGRFVGHGVYE